MSTEIRTKCVVCGAPRDLVRQATWFFVGGPAACTFVCSRACLLSYSFEQLPRPEALRVLMFGSAAGAAPASHAA